MPRAVLVTGTLFALAAGLLWGLVFIGPLLLPEYPATLQSFGRYLAFGLIALPLAWFDRKALAQLTREDWVEALKLALVGNIIYYLFLAASIRRAGGPLPTMIIGTLPVVIAITANLRSARIGTRVEARMPWLRMLPSLLLIAAGIAFVNHAELAHLAAESKPAAAAEASVHAVVVGSAATAKDDLLSRYALGALLAVGAVVCWTWYPLRNGEWLRAHPGRSPRGWATAQGLATLPLALLGYALTWAWFAVAEPTFEMPFGPRAGDFVALMVAIGLLASWLGTLCWNEASQRLPPTLVGQLIVFETLAALAYAFALRGTMPAMQTLAGIALLVGGVLWALRTRPTAVTAEAHPN